MAGGDLASSEYLLHHVCKDIGSSVVTTSEIVRHPYLLHAHHMQPPVLQVFGRTHPACQHRSRKSIIPMAVLPVTDPSNT